MCGSIPKAQCSVQPSLSCTYINDMPDAITSLSKMFADDAEVFRHIETSVYTERSQSPYRLVIKIANGLRSRSCIISHDNVGRIGTLTYDSFRWRSIRRFNSLPMHLRSISSCSVLTFKTQFDIFLGSVEDLPCLTGFNNRMVEIVDGSHPVMA